MDVDYQKYLKYKTKYFNLKKLLQVGGDSHCERKQKEMFYEELFKNLNLTDFYKQSFALKL